MLCWPLLNCADHEHCSPWQRRYVLLLLLLSRSGPGSSTPGSDLELQVAYEAALWQLTDFFFLSYEDLNRGAFPEVRPDTPYVPD